MATPFLQMVAEYLRANHEDTPEKVCVVLPNRRAAQFLKRQLARAYGRTIWLPVMLSAEEFIDALSGLIRLEEVDLVCRLYDSYKVCYGSGAEPFDSFIKWGQIILQDFNEADRYLADIDQLYRNLRDIRTIEHWSLAAETLTDQQRAYLKFMEKLGDIYTHFTATLLREGAAYQGLSCRVAADKVDGSSFHQAFQKLYFCGFNALNTAEEKIFRHYLGNGTAEALWDADRYYLDDEMQEAGAFLRRLIRIPGGGKPHFITSHLSDRKTIDIVSVPRQLGQAQVVRQTIGRWLAEGTAASDIAVVLADERLLMPVLRLLPDEVGEVNVTMGYPLRFTSAYAMVTTVIRMQVAFQRQQRKEKTIYHKDLTEVLRQPLFRAFIEKTAEGVDTDNILKQVAAHNISFVSPSRLQAFFPSGAPKVFRPANDATTTCEILAHMIETCADTLANSSTRAALLELEHLHLLLRIVNRIAAIVSQYTAFNDLNAFRQLFTQVASGATVSFSGEPLAGLQVMGLLETRCLDFPRVILVSANEGVLPSGRTTGSFLPNDLKRAFGLPLYADKDAIYSYHFYRLLQRSEEIVISCDSETDTFGKGEQSRFVTQLQMEFSRRNPNAIVRSSVAAYGSVPSPLQEAIAIPRNRDTLKEIVAKATSADKYGGLSPSGLASYKDCQLQFYFRYGTGLKEAGEVEESAEAGTFGSILHLALETLYKPFIGGDVTSAMLADDTKKHVGNAVREAFLFYFAGAEPSGKSLLQEDVIRVYVSKLVDHDVRFTESLSRDKGKLTLVALEQEYAATIGVKSGNNFFEVIIKGKMDRVDRVQTRSGSVTRVIDYKSSVRDADRFAFTGFEDLFSDRACNKQMQLMLYAWLLYKNGVAPAGEICASIIPFKVFSGKPKTIVDEKKNELRFSDKFFAEFEGALSGYIAHILSEDHAFVQTQDEEVCGFCAYSSICNRGH